MEQNTIYILAGVALVGLAGLAYYLYSKQQPSSGAGASPNISVTLS